MKKTIYICCVVWLSGTCLGITSSLVRQKTSEDFLKGKTDGVVIDSQATICLGVQSQKLDFGDALEEVWTVHSILADINGVVYLGTSPSGQILRWRDGTTEQIYPSLSAAGENDPNGAAAETQPNEHIFAMAMDVAGRILAGISGQAGKLIRISSQTETLFEKESVRYIFAIVLDKQNNIYLGTGPSGQVWRLDAFGQNAELLCDIPDKNILSLAVADDGTIYAGGDTRGVVYKIPAAGGSYTAIYDSEQVEITSLLIEPDGSVLAAATNADLTAQPMAAMSLKKSPGKTEDAAGSAPKAPGGTSLKIANSDSPPAQTPAAASPSPTPPRPQSPRGAGIVYRIHPAGFVTELFSETAIFYAMQRRDNTILLATGSKGKLFSINAQTEERSIAYEDKTSAQITAIADNGQELYLALSNPAAVVRLSKDIVSKGVYTSDLIDAGQPAQWGKFQVEADIPDGCRILLACRTGNIKEPNDATFSSWTQDVKLTEPVQIDCPVGRFLQYRLTLESDQPDKTPIVRETAAAYVVPNLAPKVIAVAAARMDKQKSWLLNLQTRAEDANRDALLYAFEFRKAGGQRWVLLKDKLDQPKYDWDTRTVEDGRYEIRITASDRQANSPQTALTGTRISDPVVVDNTAPEIVDDKVSIQANTVRLCLAAEDAYSVIAKLQYTIDSDPVFQSALPIDGVFDTTREEFDITLADIAVGEHVIAVAISDDVGNIRYKMFTVTIE